MNEANSTTEQQYSFDFSALRSGCNFTIATNREVSKKPPFLIKFNMAKGCTQLQRVSNSVNDFKS